MFSLICAWINGWVNNGEAGDLKRHRAHYDVTVMCFMKDEDPDIAIMVTFLLPYARSTSANMLLRKRHLLNCVSQYTLMC